ncbi:adenylyltransferase/cytidyltransferase family protein [Candidatus Uhrbacteria bacterium]|nr:adenylyltransferase/cytidyltransferase family protein [Candidatus Uhrbacteria bacterium]
MKKIVMCFGSFDGLHAGHEDYFRQAKDQGDELIVVVARDTTIMELRGNLPARNELDRLGVVSGHPLVDEARLGYLDDRYKIIEEIRPDIICLGFDQEAFTENLDNELARRGLSASILRCEPYEPAPPKGFAMPTFDNDENDFAEAEYDERGLPL